MKADVRPRLDQLRLRHLRLLGLLVELGSVRKAAAALHLTQPAVSVMLRQLEEAFEVRLFTRSRQGVQTTPAAAALMDRARAIGNELRHASDEVDAIERDGLQWLTIGAMPRVMLEFTPAVVELARRTWPSLRLRFIEDVAAGLLPRLRDGTVDCLLSRVPRSTLAATDAGTLAHTRLYEDGMCFVCATDHPLARRRKIRIEDLTGADWVLPPADTETRQVFVNTFLQAGLLPPQAHIESRSILSNLALAEGAAVLTIAPRSAALVRHRLGTLRILPVSVDAAVAPVALIWRHASADSATLTRFRELVQHCAQVKSRTRLQPSAPSPGS